MAYRFRDREAGPISRAAVAAVVLVPLSALALLVFGIPYRLTGYGARWFTTEPDVAATAKVVGGFLIYAAWLLVFVALAWWSRGAATALLTLLIVPLVALAGLFAFERESAVIDAIRAWFLLQRTHADTRARLKRRRSELADVLDEVNEWLSESRSSSAP